MIHPELAAQAEAELRESGEELGVPFVVEITRAGTLAGSVFGAIAEEHGVMASVARTRRRLQVVLQRAKRLGRERITLKDAGQFDRDGKRGRGLLFGNLLGDAPGLVLAEVLVILEAHPDELLDGAADAGELISLRRHQSTLRRLAQARREVVENARQAVRGGRGDGEDVAHVPQGGVVGADALKLGELAEQPRPRAVQRQTSPVESQRAQRGGERHVIRRARRERPLLACAHPLGSDAPPAPGKL